jgi:hypothetical protein
MIIRELFKEKYTNWPVLKKTASHESLYAGTGERDSRFFYGGLISGG